MIKCLQYQGVKELEEDRNFF